MSTLHSAPKSSRPEPRTISASVGSAAMRVRASVFTVTCFLIGATYSFKINLVGEAALVELLLPILGLYAVFRPQGRRLFGAKVFWMLLLSMLVTLAGYVVSDVLRETAQAQYLRGWGRMALVITAFVSLSLMVAWQRQSLWWFVAGMGIGRVFYLRLVHGTPISMWKFSYDGFGYGEPVTLAAAVLAYFLPPRWGSFILAVVGALSVYYDFRIQSLVCIIVAGLLWARAGPARQSRKGDGGQLQRVVLLLAAVGVIYAGIKISENEYSASRRGVSDIGRSLGKVFAVKAISNSPWIGYGSWSRNREFHRMHQEALSEVAGKEASRFRIGDSSSATHSMILQAWVEGGILAIAFFAVLGVYLMRNLYSLMLRRPMDALSPILVYFAIYGLWHIVMSAFAAPLRLHLALAAVCVVCEALERAPRREHRRMHARQAMM